MLAAFLFTTLTTSAQVNRTIGTLPPGGTVTITFDVTINTNFPLNVFSVTNQANVTGTGINVVSDDPTTGTPNDPTITALPADLDFGDAPAPYPTLLADNGASHVVPFTGPTLYLGIVPPDIETNGLPAAGATGDNASGTNDESGVILSGGFTNGQTASVTVIASLAGRLDAWIDWNTNGSWSNPGEQVFTNLSVVAGTNVLNVSVPVLATNTPSFARFRLSSAGNLAPTGQTTDGEVEDYQVTLVASVPPAITACPPNVTTNIPGNQPTATIAFAAATSGTPVPTVTYTLGGTNITSPFAFPGGTNVVQVTASNGVPPNATCSFTVMVNHHPNAAPDTLGTVENVSVGAAMVKFIANDTDADGDALSITGGSTTSTNGGTVFFDILLGRVNYTPVNNFAGEDRFTYALGDGRGGTNVGTVVVTVRPAGAPSQNQVSITTTANGKLIRFAGIPGQNYIIQHAPATDGPWTNLSPAIPAGPTGVIEFEDTTFPPPVVRFYRTIVAP